MPEEDELEMGEDEGEEELDDDTVEGEHGKGADDLKEEENDDHF